MSGRGRAPATGVPAEQILAALARLRRADLPPRDARLFAYVYDADVPGLDAPAQAARAAAAVVAVD